MSVSARFFRLFGASHCRPYHARTSSRARDSLTANGSSDSGLNASLTCSYGTSCDEPQNSQRWPTRSGSNTEIAWQLWHLTETFAVCHPRFESGMSRSAAPRSCSTTTVSAPRVCSVAGDSVPQNGQTSACFAGFQCASAPHAGHANFCRAVADGPVLSKEVPERRLRDPPLRADLLALQVARLEARDDVGLRDAKRRRRFRRADELRQSAAGGGRGGAAGGVLCEAMPPG